MRLKKHRQDMKDLHTLANKGYGQLDYIARRYHRLILMAEEYINKDGLTKEDWDCQIDEFGGPRLKRVLKDAKCSTK